MDNSNRKHIANFDQRRCSLGEGALWHPLRKQLFWFDILNRELLSNVKGARKTWQFDEYVSAAGWVDLSNLLIASASALILFNVDTLKQETLCSLECKKPRNRSNDGRADPWGGFWVSTMSEYGDVGQGAIYRFFRGEIRKLHDNITTPNSICFNKDRGVAYFSDTRRRKIFLQKLCEDTGWPKGDPSVFIDLSPDLKPDGAVIDSSGNLWCCLYGASLVICVSPEGKILESIQLPEKQPTCPAFGSDGYRTLYVTTASKGLPEASFFDGQSIKVDGDFIGKPEPRVIL